MTLNMFTLDDSARTYAQVTINGKNQLLLLDGDPPPSSTRDLIHMIELRRENMKQRAE